MLSQRKNICLFGGTFDPIHRGHTHIAEATIDQLKLDELIVLPCKQSPHKSGQKHASAEHRLAMCQLATENTHAIRVDDFDLNAPEPSYSWRTAEHMHQQYPDANLFWLMGTDQWHALPRWNRPRHLATLVKFIVFNRGADPDPREDYEMQAIQGNHPASSTSIRKALEEKQGEGIDNWLHPGVLKYIYTNQLYGC